MDPFSSKMGSNFILMSEQISRVEISGKRHYQVKKDNDIIGTFPSVTTILSATSDKSGLVKWRKRVGEEEANRISTLSMNRGTVMHRLVELYKPLPGDKKEKLNQLKELAKPCVGRIEGNRTDYLDRISRGLWLKTYSKAELAKKQKSSV